MRMKRIAAVAVVACSFGAAACGGDGTRPPPAARLAPSSARPRRRRSSTFGVKADQPGLGLQTGGQYRGLRHRVRQDHREGARHRPGEDRLRRTTVSANREPFIEEGKVDFFVATYTINDERKEKVNFAGPYYIAGQDLLVPRRTPRSPARSRSTGKKVCSVTGSTPAKRIQKQYPKAPACSSSTPTPSAWTALDEQARSTRSPPTTSSSRGTRRSAVRRQVQGGRQAVQQRALRHRPGQVDKTGCEKINDILNAAAKDGSYKAAWDATLGKSGTPAPTLDTSKLTNCA